MKSKIYINEKNISLEQALKIMTDEWVDEGNYCAQTVLDLRDALIHYMNLMIQDSKVKDELKKEIKSLNNQIDADYYPNA